MRNFPMTRVPQDLIRPVEIRDFANQDGYRCDMIEEFLRAYNLECRHTAEILHDIAQALRDGADPLRVAAVAEDTACILDERNLCYRTAMNSASFLLTYFECDDDLDR